jgi:hypothetical protein
MIPKEIDGPPRTQPTAHQQNDDEDAHSGQHPDALIRSEFIEEFAPEHGPLLSSRTFSSLTAALRPPLAKPSARSRGEDHRHDDDTQDHRDDERSEPGEYVVHERSMWPVPLRRSMPRQRSRPVTSCGWDELVRMSVEGGGWVAHARSLAATLTEIFARSKRGRPWYKLTAPMC